MTLVFCTLGVCVVDFAFASIAVKREEATPEDCLSVISRCLHTYTACHAPLNLHAAPVHADYMVNPVCAASHCSFADRRTHCSA